jgi:hypothetical protein
MPSLPDNNARLVCSLSVAKYWSKVSSRRRGSNSGGGYVYPVINVSICGGSGVLVW